MAPKGDSSHISQFSRDFHHGLSSKQQFEELSRPSFTLTNIPHPWEWCTFIELSVVGLYHNRNWILFPNTLGLKWQRVLLQPLVHSPLSILFKWTLLYIGHLWGTLRMNYYSILLLSSEGTLFPPLKKIPCLYFNFYPAIINVSCLWLLTKPFRFSFCCLKMSQFSLCFSLKLFSIVVEHKNILSLGCPLTTYSTWRWNESVFCFCHMQVSLCFLHIWITLSVFSLLCQPKCVCV